MYQGKISDIPLIADSVGDETRFTPIQFGGGQSVSVSSSVLNVSGIGLSISLPKFKAEHLLVRFFISYSGEVPSLPASFIKAFAAPSAATIRNNIGIAPIPLDITYSQYKEDHGIINLSGTCLIPKLEYDDSFTHYVGLGITTIGAGQDFNGFVSAHMSAYTEEESFFQPTK